MLSHVHMTPIYAFISYPNHRLRDRHSRHLRHIAAAGGSGGSEVEDLEFQRGKCVDFTKKNGEMMGKPEKCWEKEQLLIHNWPLFTTINHH